MKQPQMFRPKVPKAVKDLISASKDYVDNTYLIQALHDVKAHATKMATQYEQTLKDFNEAGGSIDFGDNQQVTFGIGDSYIVITHNDDGDDYYNSRIRVKDRRLKELLYDAAVAAYSLPSIEFVRDEIIDQLINFIENNDALEGARELQEALKQEAQLQYSILSGSPSLSEVPGND